MADLELLIRGAAIGGFFALALCLVRVELSKIRLSGLLFCLSTAAHVITQSDEAMRAVGPAFDLVWLLSVMGAALFWAFITDVFSDAERDFARRFWPAALLMTVGLFGRFGPAAASDLAWVLHNLIGVGLMIHALAVIVAGWRDDLVESRRQLRGPVIAAGAIYGVVNSAVQATEILWRPLPFLSPVAAVALFFLAMVGIAVFLKSDSALFGGRARETAAPVHSPQDRAALVRLEQAMEQEEAWRREALTMFDLAKLVGAPEHRLRRLINDGLGYRNFAAFLNERRIAAAKAALAERPQAPVSSIAYEVGFASLGPFNRAFKAATGMTPTDFRKAVVPV